MIKNGVSNYAMVLYFILQESKAQNDYFNLHKDSGTKFARVIISFLFFFNSLIFY